MTELTLIATKAETKDVTTFKFEKQNIKWRAGQYMAFVLPEVSPILEQYEHWFSISSAPFQETLDITVRHSRSPFKQALMKLQLGDKVRTHTIDGDFGWPEDASLYPVYIAGGIGVTPFISMLRQEIWLNNKIECSLHYFNRPGQEIPFQDELELLAQSHVEFKLYFYQQRPLSLDPITERFCFTQNSLALIAGPPPMVDRMSAELEKHQVKTHKDWYFGYDVTNY